MRMGVFVNVCGHLSKLNSTAVKQGQRYKGVKLVRIALLRIPFPPALRYHLQEGGGGYFRTYNRFHLFRLFENLMLPP